MIDSRILTRNRGGALRQAAAPAPLHDMSSPPHATDAPRKRNWLALLTLYLLVLHVLAALALFKTDLVYRTRERFGWGWDNPYHVDTRSFRAAYAQIDRIDRLLVDAPVVLMGDSTVERLPPDALREVPRVLNLGLGGIAMRQLTSMVPGYRHLDRAQALVLHVGINDLCLDGAGDEVMAQRIGALAAALPAAVPLVWSAILPVDPEAPHRLCGVTPAAIARVNAVIAQQCKARGRCVYADGYARLADARGDLPSRFHDGDGLHLNARATRCGQHCWYRRLPRSARGPGCRRRHRTDLCVSGRRRPNAARASVPPDATDIR